MNNYAGLLGNCQMVALNKVLSSSPSFNQIYQIHFCQEIHKISVEEIQYFISNTLPNLKLFIIHHISDSYRLEESQDVYPDLNINGKLISIFSTSYLIQHLPNHCKFIKIPNCYFTAYFPELCYFKDPNNKNIRKYDIEYHDYNIFLEIHKSPSDLGEVETISKLEKLITDPKFYTKSYCLEQVNKNIKTLQQREEFTHIHISDFIVKHYRHIKLFHTFNHPTLILIKKLASRILIYLNIEPILPYDKEVIDHVIFPIYPSIYTNLGLYFENQLKYKYKGYWWSLNQTLELYYRFYTQNLKYETLEYNLELSNKFLESKNKQFYTN